MSELTEREMALNGLIEMINSHNNIELELANIEFSDPVINTNPLYPKTNTSVTVKGLAPYEGCSIIHYNRINLEDLFNHLVISLNPTDAEYLSDILPDINYNYGTNIYVIDVEDIEIPPFDPIQPYKQRYVKIKANPNSYRFYGECTIALGPKYIPYLNDGIECRYYLHIGNTVILINTEGELVTTFNFLSNAIAINRLTINRVFVSDRIILLGEFDLQYIDSSEVNHSVVANTLYLNLEGVIIGESAVSLFSNVATDTICYDRVNAVYYTLYNNDISKYTANGTKLDYIAAISQPIQEIYLETSLYAVTLPYEDDSKKVITVYKLLPNGELNALFTPIRMSCSDPLYNPLRITALKEGVGNSLYVSVDPIYGVDAANMHPVINGIDILTDIPNGNTTYSWNPVFKFNSDGSLDPYFSLTLKTNNYPSIYVPNETIVNNNLVISTNTHSVEQPVLFTNHINAATGFTHIHPLLYTYYGAIDNEFILGFAAYQYKWNVVNQIVRDSAGYIIVSGRMQEVINLTLGYSTPHYAVVRYTRLGVPDKVLYRDLIVPVNAIYSI